MSGAVKPIQNYQGTMLHFKVLQLNDFAPDVSFWWICLLYKYWPIICWFRTSGDGCISPYLSVVLTSYSVTLNSCEAFYLVLNLAPLNKLIPLVSVSFFPSCYLLTQNLLISALDNWNTGGLSGFLKPLPVTYPTMRIIVNQN